MRIEASSSCNFSYFPFPIAFLDHFTLPVDMQPKNGVYTVGDFMTKKDDLRVVKPTTTVDEGIC